MRQYDLGSEEGVLLMCVAEALLRIPDQEHRRQADPRQARRCRLEEAHGPVRLVLVNASTWGLMLTGHLVDLPTRPSATCTAPSSACSAASASR
jgi:RHH-type proline utilization regulon transcriptional repressor/proline dehydrogenase/delta 1-pyrroline-5-carboxylate dehydrogenase